MDEKSWNIIYEIIKHFSHTEKCNFSDLVLYKILEEYLPTDKGLSVIQMKDNIPVCIRWPDYASELIPLFNNRLNRNAPAVYNPFSHMLGPVNWKKYSHTEYYSEFNKPLNIGCSIGFDIIDALNSRTIIFVLHESTADRTFISENEQLFRRIQPILQNLFDMRSRISKQEYRQLLPAELGPGHRSLSTREREILQYLLSRLSVKNIASELYLSPRTVETHALHIYQKLGVSSRKELQHILLPVTYVSTDACAF